LANFRRVLEFAKFAGEWPLLRKIPPQLGMHKYWWQNLLFFLSAVIKECTAQKLIPVILDSSKSTTSQVDKKWKSFSGLSHFFGKQMFRLLRDAFYCWL
jgi:hypothetical protein